MIRVAHLFEGPQTIGAVTILKYIVEQLDREKFEPVLVAALPGAFVDSMAQAGYRVHVLESNIGTVMRKLLASRSKNPVRFCRLYAHFRRDAKKLRRLLDQEKIDITHSHHYHHHLLSAMACRKDIPSIWHLHGIVNPRSLFGLQNRIYNYYADKYASGVIAVSNAVRQSMAASVQQKTTVIYNGLEAEKYPSCSMEQSRKKIGLDMDKPLVGAVGRFVPIKGFHNFISMAKIVVAGNKDVRFVIIGPADIPEERAYRDACISQIEQAGLSSRFTLPGRLSDPAEFMPALNVLVLPTVTWEGFGLVALEAQACGVPVVTTDCGGPSDIVAEGRTGYIVPKQDVALMAERVSDLLREPARSKSMGIAARRKVAGSQFRIPNIVSRVEEMYLAVTSR
ncbi:MAG: glycosyltransferase family 4 protein [Sedimentisphaerales bacterium]|nr:glycosyltransferase family 4 protein [Sedimentisphaerales bacterium]